MGRRIVIVIIVVALGIGLWVTYHQLFDAKPQYAVTFSAEGFANQLVYSPDGHSIILTGLYRITHLDADNGKLLKAWTFDAIIDALVYSPDSRQIVFHNQASNQLSILTLATGAIEPIPLPDQYTVQDLALSPDGSWLAVAGPTTLLIPFPNHAPVATIPNDSVWVTFSTDGQQLFAVGLNGRVARYPTRQPADPLATTLPSADDQPSGIALDATGQKLVLTTENGKMLVLDTTTLTLLAENQLPSDVQTDLLFSYVLSAEWLAVLQVDTLWLIRPETGSVVSQYTVDDGHVIAVDFKASNNTMALYTHQDDKFTLSVWGIEEFIAAYAP